jgi:hypothetical protein
MKKLFILLFVLIGFTAKSQTKNTDISLSAGTYSFSITRGSYTGSSGNNASITCL